jgi:hypothetical protein
MIASLLPALEPNGRLALSDALRALIKSVSAATIDRMRVDVRVAAAGIDGWGSIRRSVVKRQSALSTIGMIRRRDFVRPTWRRNRSESQSSNPSSDLLRETGLIDRQPPSESQRFTVLREQPSSLAIRFLPQPRACSASIADTSSGVRISILRDTPVRERSCND